MKAGILVDIHLDQICCHGGRLSEMATRRAAARFFRRNG